MFHHGPGIYGWWMILIWILILVFLAIMIYFVVKSINKNRHHRSAGESPLDILKDRYAKGKIDREEFEERKKHLN